jgi:hypothetical protein
MALFVQLFFFLSLLGSNSKTSLLYISVTHVGGVHKVAFLPAENPLINRALLPPISQQTQNPSSSHTSPLEVDIW